MNNIVIAWGLVLLLGSGIAYAAGTESTGQPTGAAVKPQAAITKGKSPSPAASASQKTTIGKEKTTVNTANAEDDQDSFWVETLDVDGDGNTEEADLLYDDEDKVLFLFADGEFTCTDGSTGEGALLMAVNQDGSGWYIVDIDEGECKAEAAGLYGCKFDASGNPTACGVAVIDEKNDEIVIETVSN